MDFVQLSMEASYNKNSSLRKMTKSSRTTSVHNCWNKKTTQGYCLWEGYADKHPRTQAWVSVEGARTSWRVEI